MYLIMPLWLAGIFLFLKKFWVGTLIVGILVYMLIEGINGWMIFGLFALLVLLSGAALIWSAIKPKDEAAESRSEI